MTEYVNIMEVLVGPIHSATGKSEAECGKDEDELKQEEDGTYADPDLLSYIDKLCSQEEFVTKVGWAWSLGSTRLQGMELSAPKICNRGPHAQHRAQHHVRTGAVGLRVAPRAPGPAGAVREF